VALDWLRELLGLPKGTEGVTTSGGSLANLTALAAARSAEGPGVCYMSDQTHSSIPRGLTALGFTADQVRVLPADEQMRLPVAALAAAIREDRSAGRRPGFVVANAGTTNTGAVDPLVEIAALARREGLWLHIDGAYGASAALCEAGRRVLGGLELADSVVLDPHKWLFQPYDLACLLVTRPGILKGAFHMAPDYLADVTAVSNDEVDFRDRSLELTRRPRALKLWLSFRVYGADRMSSAVARGIALAEYAQRLIASDQDWRVVTPAQLGIVTFARRGAGRREHHATLAGIREDGYAHITTTSVGGQAALRLCTINPRTTDRDVAETLERLGVRTEG
jgi:glutamate/tyrosine decarboxylase-like PLP-dependent enzyme